MELGLENKTVFIAGSSSGIGFSISEHFLEEGAQVAITGRNNDNLDRAYQFLKEKYSDKKVLKIQADLFSGSEIEKALRICYDCFGKVDIAIANMGSGKEPQNLDFNEETLRESFEKNLLGSLLLAKHTSLKMIEQKSGVIIFISSIAGIEDIQAPIAYSIHKAALSAAIKKLSRQLGSFAIRVNGIAPGNVFFLGGTWDKKLKDSYQATRNYIDREVPLKVFGEPSDVANLALFLASEKAKFITGSLMVVDGGQTKSF